MSRTWTASVAYLSLITGAGLSVAGNLADTYRVRGSAVDAVDIALAIGPPVATLLVAELFVSEWPREISMQAVRWVTTIMVGSLAMVVSWLHLSELLAARGQTPMVAILWPLAIDGLAIMAMAKLLAMRGRVATPEPEPVAVSAFQPAVAMDHAAMARFGGHAASLANDDGLVSDMLRHGQHDFMATPDGQPEPMAMRPASDLAAWQTGYERGIDEAGQELASEAEAFANGGRPVPVVPGRQRKVPEEAVTMIREWTGALKELDEIVAAHFGKSTRTARAWRAIVMGAE